MLAFKVIESMSIAGISFPGLFGSGRERNGDDLRRLMFPLPPFQA